MRNDRPPQAASPTLPRSSAEQAPSRSRRAPSGRTLPHKRKRLSIHSIVTGSGEWVPHVATAQGPRPSLRIGDVLVCGPHGVGEVIAAGIEEIAGIREAFFTLRLAASGVRVLFPARRLAEVGLRPVVSRATANKILAQLKRRRRRRSQENWNQRQKKLSAMLRTGMLDAAAEVLAEVLLQRKRKPLSITETKLLDGARARVITELALATGRSELQLRQEIDGFFGF